jgi:hypothetical protein
MLSVVMVSVLAFDFDLRSITLDFWYMSSKWSVITLRTGRMSNHSDLLFYFSLFVIKKNVYHTHFALAQHIVCILQYDIKGNHYQNKEYP